MGESMICETAQQPMTAEEKKHVLYLRQKHTLDLFLGRSAISCAQYDKSLGDLTVKMSMERGSATDCFSMKLNGKENKT